MNCYAAYINLDHRTDRRAHMEAELSRVGIEAERTRGIPWTELDHTAPKMQVMKARTPGAIGCHYSQVSVIEKALELGRHALVMEDDLIFCSDFQDRMKIVEDFLESHEWDIFWLGGTYHIRPKWHHNIQGKHTHEDMQDCNCNWGTDWTNTDNPYIRRTFGCWSTYAYIVNVQSLPKVLELLEANVHKSMGIDWLMMYLSPHLHTYAFNPGMVKQMDSRSDIGDGVTEFSRFANLGKHWWADRM